MFAGANPAELDMLIEKFIDEKKGRSIFEVRHYGSFNQVHKNVPAIPGMQLPPGMQQIEVQAMFYDVLVYIPAKEELIKAPQSEGTADLQLSK